MTNYGTRALAGPFAGLGVMLGSNAAPLSQLIAEWFAITPAMYDRQRSLVHPDSVIAWQPPEQTQESPVALVARLEAKGWIGQAESQAEYDQAIAASKTRALTVRRGLACNSWLYGPLVNGFHRWRRGWVAMPEIYVNAQPNLAEWEYICDQYVKAGARCIVPLLGGWSDDNDAPAVYAGMRGRFPGVCVYAGEDPIAPGVLAAVRNLP